MKNQILFLALAMLLLVFGNSTAQQGKKQAAGAILYKVNAVELAKEFKTDPAKAKKKYNRKPPPGGVGGVIVELSGVVKKFQARGKTKDLYLETKSDIAVVLRAKKINVIPVGKKHATGQGKFTQFSRMTVIIECDEAKLRQIIGKKTVR